jgi:hypothetical protein
MTINIKVHSKSRLILVLAAVVATVAGCSTAPTPVSGKMTATELQSRAIERSTARWKALTDKRFEESFNFLSEASRIGTTVGEYAAAMQRMGFVTAKTDNAVCDESLCVVKSTVTIPVYVRNVGARPQAIPVEEHWIANNGELWLIRR